MPPNTSWKRTELVTGRGEMVFPDGARVAVFCEIEVWQEYADDGYPMGRRIDGRVKNSKDPYFGARYNGKPCVLEVKGRRLPMQIDGDGNIGLLGQPEGFPDVKS